jgi:hypothetical protein
MIALRRCHKSSLSTPGDSIFACRRSGITKRRDLRKSAQHVVVLVEVIRVRLASKTSNGPVNLDQHDHSWSRLRRFEDHCITIPPKAANRDSLVIDRRLLVLFPDSSQIDIQRVRTVYALQQCFPRLLQHENGDVILTSIHCLRHYTG